MEKRITFGENSATLISGEKSAKLYLKDDVLPIALADILDKEDKIDVYEVQKKKDCSCIRMFHNLTSAEILDTVCYGITLIYNTDISVSNAPV